MKYEIRLSAPNGDIIPLSIVADAKARSRAVAGGTEFHDPTYQGFLAGFSGDLLHEALEGRLTVCDQWGSPKTADAIIKEAESAGELVFSHRFLVKPDRERLRILQHGADQERIRLVQQKVDRGEHLEEHETLDPRPWDYTGIDFGPSELDWTTTRLDALFITLKWLNAWALDRGDEFTISHDGVGWGDERGWVQPAPARPVGITVDTQATPESSDPTPRKVLVPPPGLAYWRFRLYDQIREIDAEHGGQATPMQAIATLKALRDDRLPVLVGPIDTPDILRWRTDDGKVKTVKSKTVGNALADARKWLIDASN